MMDPTNRSVSPVSTPSTVDRTQLALCPVAHFVIIQQLENLFRFTIHIFVAVCNLST